MKNTILQVIAVTVFAIFLYGCQSDMSKQKKWIYANIETKVWQEKTYNAVNAVYQSLQDDALDYIDGQVQVCRSNWNSSDARDERDLDMFLGTSWRELEYYFGGDSRQKINAGREQIIKEYKEHCVDVLNKLCDYYSVCLDSFRDSLSGVQDFYDSDEICRRFLGTPTSYSEPESVQLYEVAELNVMAALQNLNRPKIASCQYDKEKQLWIVRIDNGDNQYVKFYQRDDGDFDIEYGNSLDVHGQPIKLD